GTQSPVLCRLPLPGVADDQLVDRPLDAFALPGDLPNAMEGEQLREQDVHSMGPEYLGDGLRYGGGDPPGVPLRVVEAGRRGPEQLERGKDLGGQPEALGRGLEPV